jgi:hypothetical protein
MVVLTDTASNGWNGGTFSLSDEVGFLAQDSTVVDSLNVTFQICLNVIPPVLGCTDSTACNYNLDAEEDDGSCATACGGCTVDWAMNFDPQARRYSFSAVVLLSNSLQKKCPTTISNRV